MNLIQETVTPKAKDNLTDLLTYCSRRALESLPSKAVNINNRWSKCLGSHDIRNGVIMILEVSRKAHNF